MAEDPEKRFHSIMDKLFHAPKSVSTSSSSSSVQLTRGKKRQYPETALAPVEPITRGDGVRSSSSAPGDAPSCRPWERGDLMRRLATFKSMTWFAKPKVASAVNCARRGWINVDMDTIACEACGARLLFTAPSSWSQQQVEKAALVFSLQLDKGHKSLCPWIDNACDVRLAEFPPTPPEVLVDKYRERFVAFSQLLALPVISSSAIEFMRNPQLEEFLRQYQLLDYGSGSPGVTQIVSLEDEGQAGSVSLYYQAQKLLSLCGWEPRALSYFVDCKDRPKDANFSKSSSRVHSSVAVEGNQDTCCDSESYADPNSIVLDCRLCGASVGLWTFSMVPQPIEFFRVTGCSEVYSKRSCGQVSENVTDIDLRGGTLISSTNDKLSSTDRPSDFKLSIAGGPPPMKQNFKATISLPVIGRNLRARFSEFDFRDHSYSNIHISSEGTKGSGLTTLTEATCHETIIECPIESVSDRSDQSEILPEKAAEPLGSAVGFSNGSEVGGTSVPDLDANMTIGNDNNALIMNTVDDINQHQGQESDILCSENTVRAIDSREGATGSGAQKPLVAQEKGQGDVKDGEQITMDTKAYGTGNQLKQPALDKAMEFDLIKQHRYFCPWIASTTNVGPGWQQTLAALQRQKEHSHPSPSSPPSSSIIKVDDPITSVRKLFMSPSGKKLKPS